MERGSIVTIFARCFRGIVKLSAVVGDGFFSVLLEQESDMLLNSYVIFLKHREKGGNIVQRSNYVAQCYTVLIFQIKSILKLIHILKHLEFVKGTTPLLVERDFLLLKRAILSSQLKQRTESCVDKTIKPEKLQIKLQAHPDFDFSSQLHREIAQFIVRQERVQNTEVFKEFSTIAQRTLKRKLSELIKIDAIKRITEGKKVFYTGRISPAME